MYEFILWMCLQTKPECPVWQSVWGVAGVEHLVKIYPMESREACEEAWRDSLKSPDPAGMKAQHICQPVSEPI